MHHQRFSCDEVLQRIIIKHLVVTRYLTTDTSAMEASSDPPSATAAQGTEQASASPSTPGVQSNIQANVPRTNQTTSITKDVNRLDKDLVRMSSKLDNVNTRLTKSLRDDIWTATRKLDKIRIALASLEAHDASDTHAEIEGKGKTPQQVKTEGRQSENFTSGEKGKARETARPDELSPEPLASMSNRLSEVAQGVESINWHEGTTGAEQGELGAAREATDTDTGHNGEHTPDSPYVFSVL